MSEDLGKQIYKKIPYCLLFSFIINLLIEKDYLTRSYSLIIYFTLLFLVFFWGSNKIFIETINEPLSDLFSEMNLSELIKKFHSIYANQISLLDDVDKIGSRFILSGVINGISLTIFLTLLSIIIQLNYEISIDLKILSIFIIILYFIYESNKSQIIDEKIQNKSTDTYDFIENYAIKNSLKHFKYASLALFYHLGRIIGPIVYLNVPKIGLNNLLVFETSEFKQLLTELSNPKEDQEIKYEYESGDSISYLITDDIKSELAYASDLIEKSPRENFPYLLDPNFDGKKHGWTALRIHEKITKRVIGHIFIQKYKGVMTGEHNRATRRKIWRSRDDVSNEEKRVCIYNIFILGERSHVSYLVNLINMYSAKVPVEILSR